jgi:glucose-6-phosphate-specific signal transduction histidine kinase
MLKWLNHPIYTRGQIEFRRIDVVLALGFVACVAYYWITVGWQGAIIGGLMYILVLMIALWVL